MKRLSCKKGFTLVELLIVIAIIGIVGTLFFNFTGGFMSGQADAAGARAVLENAYSFTDINIIGYNPNVCHQDDIYATEFTAKNPKGVLVRGVVCGSSMGEKTVRFAP